MSSLFYDIIIFPVVWFFLGGGDQEFEIYFA